jgi:phosphoglucomutase
VVITPSHNPPEDGGFKYNPPSGGPADTATTRWIQDRANQILAAGCTRSGACRFEKALQRPPRTSTTTSAVRADLKNVIDMEPSPRRAEDRRRPDGRLGGRLLGADRRDVRAEPRRWSTRSVDPTFAFMTLDHDGKIRMDCSSPYAMASLVKLKDQFDIAFGNDPDYDRHGIVTRSVGLMNPNHYLAVAIWYLFQNRPGLGADVAVGKTLVSSSMIDRVAAHLGRRLCEVPVGFKWFVDGLLDGSSASAARRAPGLPSCAGRHRLDDRQGRLHPRPAGRRDHWRSPGATRASTTRTWKPVR